MNPLIPSTAALAVSAIFCLWRNYHAIQSRKKQQLRQRVAYLLWSVAHRGQ